MSKLLPFMLCCLMTVTAFGQETQNHRVSFSDIDGFSGEVSFTSSREGFATQLRGKNATLSITDYKCSDEDEAALKNAGLNLWSGFQPKTFGVVVQGKAYVQEVYYHSNSVSNDKLHLSQGLGDFTTPTFDEDVQARAKEFQRKYNESYWERYGGFDAKDVTELYLSDLKNEIDRITYAAKKEKQKAEQKEKEAKEKSEKEKQAAIAKNNNASGGNGAGDKADDAEQSSSESSQTSGSSERGSAANKPRQQSNHQENIRKYNAINRDIANVDKAHNEFNNAIDQVSAGMAEKTRADQQASRDWWEGVDDRIAAEQTERKTKEANILKANEERKKYNNTVVEKIQRDYIIKETFFTDKVKGADYRYVTYVVEQNGLLGILEDNGNPIYSPQFNGISVVSINHCYPNFLVKIKDKWGEVNYNGKIIEDAKYDGIWYTPNAVKVLKSGNDWIVKSYGTQNNAEAHLTAQQIKEKFVGGVIPVMNTLQDGYSYNMLNDLLLTTENNKLYNVSIERINNSVKLAFKLTTDGQSGKVGKLFQLENKWFQYIYDYNNKTVSITEMPQRFIMPICRKYGDNRQYIWGAVNQSGEVIIPVEHKYLKKISDTKWETDKGMYNNNGELINR